MKIDENGSDKSILTYNVFKHSVEGNLEIY